MFLQAAGPALGRHTGFSGWAGAESTGDFAEQRVQVHQELGWSSVPNPPQSIGVKFYLNLSFWPFR